MPILNNFNAFNNNSDKISSNSEIRKVEKYKKFILINLIYREALHLAPRVITEATINPLNSFLKPNNLNRIHMI